MGLEKKKTCGMELSLIIGIIKKYVKESLIDIRLKQMILNTKIIHILKYHR